MAEDISSKSRALRKVRNALTALESTEVEGTVRTDGIKQPPPRPRPGMPRPRPVRAQQPHPDESCQICSFCDHCDPQPEERGKHSVRVCRCQKLMNYMPPGSPGHICMASIHSPPTGGQSDDYYASFANYTSSQQSYPQTTSYSSQYSAAAGTWSSSGQFSNDQYAVPRGSPVHISAPQSACPTYYQTPRYAEEYSAEPDALQTGQNSQNVWSNSSRCYRCSTPLSSCVNQHLPVAFHRH